MNKLLTMCVAAIVLFTATTHAQTLTFTYGYEDLPVNLTRPVLVPLGGYFENTHAQLPTTYNCQVLNMECKIVSGWSANVSYCTPMSNYESATNETHIRIPYSVITLSGVEYDNLKSYDQVIHPEITRIRFGITHYFQDEDKNYYAYATGGVVYNHAVVYANSTESIADTYDNIYESVTNSSRTEFSGYNGFAGLGFRYNWRRMVINVYSLIDFGYSNDFDDVTYSDLAIFSIPSDLNHTRGKLTIGGGFMYGINVGIRL